MERAGKPATVRDVAARAGVSATVVSHVLHGRAAAVRVSPATAERVREAARDLGYRRNALAGQFRGQRTRMIGVVHGTDVYRPTFNAPDRYFGALMDGLVDRAFDGDYSVTLCPSLLGTDREAAMSDGRFDGIVWYRPLDDPGDVGLLMRCPVPVVLLHSPAAVLQHRYPSVRCDNDDAMRQVVAHLAELGHRRLTFFIEPWQRRGEGVFREAAFRAAAAAAGFPPDRAEVAVWDPATPFPSEARASTGWIAWRDALGAQLIDAAAAAGLTVPGDRSIVGFDSTSFCNETRPRLTSVAQPLTAMGRAAMDALLRLIAGESGPAIDTVVRCTLDVRESTGASSGSG